MDRPLGRRVRSIGHRLRVGPLWPGRDARGWVLCRPHGGLNDTLVQIERCLGYARLARRGLIIDTTRDFFRSPLFESLVPRGDSIGIPVLDRPEDAGLRADTTTLPSSLEGGLDYAVHVRESETSLARVLVDARGRPLTFDFARRHAADVLVHEQSGGGPRGHRVLAVLRMRSWLREHVLERLEPLPRTYTALHIRNTDLRGDVLAFLRDVASDIQHETVVVATDDPRVVDVVRAELPDRRVVTVARLAGLDGSPLHRARSLSWRTVVGETFVDLIALARARQLIAAPVVAPWGTTSGFSMLARKLQDRPHVIEGLLAGD